MKNLYLPKPWQQWLQAYRFEYYQAIYWIGYSGFTFMNNSFLAQPFRWWEVLLTIGFVMAIVYSIVYVFLRDLKPAMKTFFVLVAMFALYAMLFYLVAFVWHKPFGKRLLGSEVAFAMGAYLFTMFLYWYHSMVEAGLLAAIYRVLKNERQKRKLMQENHRTQLQFLMAQIEPHEQYNLLDIPYALALKSGESKVAKALDELKSYTQYVQEKARDVEGEVPLGDELTHCKRIVAVNNRRFDEVYVGMEVPEELWDWYVPALSISSVMQNAFKYGISWDSQAPIVLRVECSASKLEVVVRNKINPHKSEQRSSGIGNENIQRRLKLIYGDQAHLDTLQTDEGWYETRLTLTK
ncbi:sensor histidine kinase [Parapedobacter tibetensis]|uniref:sensor histidine kinase n=1 Tax=Parapedobacter tibetensis TaxID=2972951 RepID=UPI00214D5CCD|nr:histidine kinase [Parapedobacter tibetensis]